MFNYLKAERSYTSKQCLKEISEFIHIQIYIHAGFPELYDPILELITVSYLYLFIYFFYFFFFCNFHSGCYQLKNKLEFLIMLTFAKIVKDLCTSETVTFG